MSSITNAWLTEHLQEDLPDVVILAGGQGSRLRSVVGEVPKPLATIAGRPFIDWLLLSLRAQGVKRVIFATGYKAGLVEEYLRCSSFKEMMLHSSRESSPLQTAGAVVNALRNVQTPQVLILNGDSICRFDIHALRTKHFYHSARVTMWVVEVDDTRQFGQVKLEPSGRVVGFAEKPTEATKGLVSAGIYLFERSLLDSLPANVPLSLELDVIPTLTACGLYAVKGPSPLLDIGTPQSFAFTERVLIEEPGRLGFGQNKETQGYGKQQERVPMTRGSAIRSVHA